MMQKPSLVVLDIGSHKLEELQVLLCPFPRQLRIYVVWLVKQLIKLVLKRDADLLSSLRRQAGVIKYYFLSRRRYNLTIVAIEPNPAVALPHVARISRRYRTVYIPAAVLGHDAEATSELKLLYTYGNSISNSLYRKDRPADATQQNVCVGLKLSVIWAGLVKEGIVAPDSGIILRMNCEGAELGVLRDCEDAGLRLKCVIGSIGDVDKIHGRTSGDAARNIMKNLAIEYHYFKGDDPATWHGVVAAWDACARDYIVKT